MDATPPAPADLDLSGATFSVTWRASGTHQALALMADDVWFWSFVAPSPPWSGSVGSFRCESTERERAALLDIANRLGGEPARPEEHPGTGHLGLLLAAGAHRAWVDAGSDLASGVQRATAPLLAGERPRPVSAVRLRADVMTFPGLPPLLGLGFDSIGTEPSTVRLDADHIVLVGPDGDWRTVPRPRMGLVDGDGALLDGLYQAATVPAGEVGVWTLAEADATGVRRVVVSGTIDAAGPVPAASPAFAMSADIA